MCYKVYYLLLQGVGSIAKESKRGMVSLHASLPFLFLKQFILYDYLNFQPLKMKNFSQSRAVHKHVIWSPVLYRIVPASFLTELNILSRLLQNHLRLDFQMGLKGIKSQVSTDLQ